MKSSAAPNIRNVDHIHVYVADRQAAERWYERVLGFARVEAYAFWASDGGPLTLQNASGTVHIALFERPHQPCRSTIALSVGGDEFLAWQRHLSAALDQPPSLEDHSLSLSLYFRDPDGNPYEITTYEVERAKSAAV